MPIIFIDDDRPETPPSEPEKKTSVDMDLAEIGSNVVATQENLESEELDVTWGGKKTRYMYNYTLQDPSENSDDTDQTESVLSIQSKSTLLLESEPEVVSCAAGCICQRRKIIDYEYEPVSDSSTSFNLDNSNYSSESSVLMDYKFPKKIIASDNISHYSSDTGYVPDSIHNPDDFVRTKGKKIPPPACFKLCLQCRQENPNAYFQYCYTCFKNRMEFFEEKPKPRKKKSFNSAIYTKSCNSFVDSQKPGPSNFHPSGSVSMSEVLAQKTTDQSKDISDDSVEMCEKTKNICKVCFMMPQNGVFNHGKVAHIYSCYSCTKELYKKSKKCPVCNVKVKFITKMIVV